jgi:proline iminopeptidase
MMASAAEYNAYAKDVLAPQMDPKILKQLQDIENNRFLIKYSELLFKYYYTEHVLRMPLEMARIHQPMFQSLMYMFICKVTVNGITGNATLKIGMSAKLKPFQP